MATTVGAQDLIRTPLIPEAILRRPSRSLWSDAFRQFRRHKLAMLGTFIFLALVLITVLGPVLYRTPTNEIDYAQGLHGPSLDHPFGTDDLGRDVMARAFIGGRVSMAVGIVAVLIAISFGTLVGALAGFFGGQVDGLLMRLTDLFLGLPQLPLLLMVIYLFRDPVRKAFGPELGIFLLMVSVIGLLNWMPLARLVRASFLSLKQKEFVEAARCIGATNGRLMAVHILPNTLSAVIVAATVGIGQAIITESALSFLGLGFPPDMPTWGRLLYDAQNYLDLGPHWAIFPGLLIFLTVLSVNYIGDGMRDALDPRKTN
jgi:peptide/nickel transport system permease protein